MNKQLLEEVIALRHHLHTIPNLSLQETQTKNEVMRYLREHTSSWQLIDRGAWFYVMKKGTGNKRIAFRCDLDALPIADIDTLPYTSTNEGVSHRCGHDGHMAAMCGLALLLDEQEYEKTVYLIFQHAEEIGQGGEECAQLLVEEHIDEVYAYHNLSGYAEGEIVYRHGLTQPASEGLRIQLVGKTSHASAPENGLNPSQAIADMVTYANTLLAQLQANSDRMILCTVVGVKVGDGDFGISPDFGEVRFTLRSEDEADMKQMEESLITKAHELAHHTGLVCTSEILDYFPETRNDDRCLEKAIRVMDDLSIPNHEMNTLWRASEDYGYFTKVCPGAIVYVGNGVDYAPLHTIGYDFNDRILETVMRLFKGLVCKKD